MKAILIPILLLTSQLALPAEIRSVKVSAMSEIKVEPDEVLIKLAVHSREKLLINAKVYNDKTTEEILKLAPRFGVAKADVKVVDLKVTPDYGSYSDRSITPIAYDFRRDIDVRMTDFKKIEPFLSKAFDLGLKDVRSLIFRVTNQRKHQFEARRLAVVHAREKADHLTELTGMKVGLPISIQEDIEYNYYSGGFGGFGGGSAGGGGAAISKPSTIPVVIAPARTPKLRQSELNQTARTKATSKNVSLRSVSQQDAKNRDERATDFAPGQITISAEVTIEYEMSAR